MENQSQTAALLQSKGPENITGMWVWWHSTEPRGNEKQRREASSQFSHKASDIPLPPPSDGSETAKWFHRTQLLHTWSLTRNKSPNLKPDQCPIPKSLWPQRTQHLMAPQTSSRRQWETPVYKSWFELIHKDAVASFPICNLSQRVQNSSWA